MHLRIIVLYMFLFCDSHVKFRFKMYCPRCNYCWTCDADFGPSLVEQRETIIREQEAANAEKRKRESRVDNLTMTQLKELCKEIFKEVELPYTEVNMHRWEMVTMIRDIAESDIGSTFLNGKLLKHAREPRLQVRSTSFSPYATKVIHESSKT